jgi:hypothetical protein
LICAATDVITPRIVLFVKEQEGISDYAHGTVAATEVTKNYAHGSVVVTEVIGDYARGSTMAEVDV